MGSVFFIIIREEIRFCATLNIRMIVRHEPRTRRWATHHGSHLPPRTLWEETCSLSGILSIPSDPAVQGVSDFTLTTRFNLLKCAAVCYCMLKMIVDDSTHKHESVQHTPTIHWHVLNMKCTEMHCATRKFLCSSVMSHVNGSCHIGPRHVALQLALFQFRSRHFCFLRRNHIPASGGTIEPSVAFGWGLCRQ